MGMKRVKLHIEALPEGLPPWGPPEIAAGLEAELGRVLADPDGARRLTGAGDVARLALGRLAIAPGSKPREIGMATAQGIGAQGIGRRGKP